jgi:predicted metal-binding membrane protein
MCWRYGAWLTFNGWLVGAATLALAGLFQFSALKYRCLMECRMPFAFVARHWRGENAAREALLLGAHHGLYCVGCCWALMLVMLVVGLGSVGWMLLLGALMAAEKNLPWGRRLSAPLGLVLLGWSGWIAVTQV